MTISGEFTGTSAAFDREALKTTRGEMRRALALGCPNVHVAHNASKFAEAVIDSVIDYPDIDKLTTQEAGQAMIAILSTLGMGCVSGEGVAVLMVGINHGLQAVNANLQGRAMAAAFEEASGSKPKPN